jgi:hypothetical protein
MIETTDMLLRVRAVYTGVSHHAERATRPIPYYLGKAALACENKAQINVLSMFNS